MRCCSRCTGYRPILDAFKVFAKADPAAYTEESIAASQGLLQNRHASHGSPANGHANGHANGGSTNGDAACTDGHAVNKTSDGSHAANGQHADKHAENGHSNGHDASSSKGTVKELTGASNSNGSKVSASHHLTLPLRHLTATINHACALPTLVALVASLPSSGLSCTERAPAWSTCTAGSSLCPPQHSVQVLRRPALLDVAAQGGQATRAGCLVKPAFCADVGMSQHRPAM